MKNFNINKFATKIAIINSHPIQYFCPQYVSWAKIQELEIKVFFASSVGLHPYIDPGFGMETQWDGIPLDFQHEFLNGGKSLPTDDRLDAVDLEKRLDSYGPDVLIVYGYSQKLQRRALNWGNAHNKIVLFFSDSENRQDRRFFKKVLKRLLLPWIFRKVSGVLTTGDANEDYYLLYGIKAENMFRVPHPIDKENFKFFFIDKMQHRKALRAKLKIPEKNIICCMVAKLLKQKRQKDLILALSCLERKYNLKNITALIVGTGEEEKELRKLAASLHHNQIIFTGFIQPVELPKYYSATDIYVLPASRDPHSISVSEAIYMGCPVIVSDKCGSYGPTDDVQPGRNGFVYECGNIESLARQISTLASDRNLIECFSHASRDIGLRNQIMSHGEGLKTALAALNIY